MQMEFVNIHDAKTNLSKYLERVHKNHETFIICRNGVPVGQLTEYTPKNKKIFGVLKSKIKISDDFDDELPSEIFGDYQ